jgi:hypothetical protein
LDLINYVNLIFNTPDVLYNPPTGIPPAAAAVSLA